MAREIVTWCDPCMGHEERTPGEEVTITLGSPSPRVLALCGPHRDEYVKPLAALLEEFGAPVEGAAPKGSKRVVPATGGPEKTLLDFTQTGTRKGKKPEGDRGSQCLWCPLAYAGDGSGLANHLHTAHGLPRSLKQVFGNGACPVCGKFTQLLGAHLSRVHPEFTSMTAAYLWAKENGDPYGRYAEVLSRAKVIG